MTLEELVSTIKKANKAYYVDGVSIISDAEYDKLIEELKKKDPKNLLLKQVGEESSSEKNKIELPNPMGSLNKIRPDNSSLEKLYGNKELLLMPKLDGLSIQIKYNKEGKFEAMYSRGDGFIGQDITDRASYMNFPKQIPLIGEDSYFFGEAVISKENFSKVKGDYKHPRNFVGGTLRPILTKEDFDKVSEEVKFNLSLIDFVCWDSITGQDSLSNALEEAKLFGFKASSYKKVTSDSFKEEQQIKAIQSLMEGFSYLADGIVVKVNDKKVYNNLGKESNGLNPKGGRAIKLEAEQQYQEIDEIKEIEWNITKRGLFVPVLILKEGRNFDGAEVTRINGCNIAYLKEKNCYIGNQVSFCRSGDVIPRAISAWGEGTEFGEPKICPYCGQPISSNETNIYCANPDCQGRKKAEIISFFTSLKLEDVSYETISYLYDNGFDTYEKLLTISYDDLIKLDGFKASKSLKVERELNNALKDITLAKLMTISQIFCNEKTGLAETKLSWVIDSYGEQTILDSLNGVIDEEGKFKKLDPEVLTNIKGFGEASIKLFKENWLEFKRLYLRVKPYLQLKTNILTDGPLNGMIFAFTKFRDSLIEELIMKNGGEVKGVTKKTTVLFAAEDSTKCRTAEKYGIPIIPSFKCREYIENLLK